ncbi:MAG TPA: MarR family transcriptional regulator [Chthoniobacteraceae bacterium]|jgi:DNA-binding MarR family transcriptional regulator
MPLLMLKDVPRYECLLNAAQRYPDLNPAASAAFLHLLRTGDDVFAAESRFLSEHGISHGRFTVLMLLNRFCDRPSTPAELAEEAAVTRATMTGLIDTLEKDGLVARDTDPADRRTVLVQLTESGVALMEEMVPKYFRCVSAIMQPLTEAERQHLVRLLQKIQSGLLVESSPSLVPTA